MFSTEDPPQQEVSCQVLLWAILALALNGMAQPSRHASTALGSPCFGEGLLDLQLSSPIYCLVHAVIDATTMLREGWKTISGRSRASGLPTPSTSISGPGGESRIDRRMLVARMILFALAVLPQAIRIFSMRGVLVTQTVAAVFLFSAVTQILGSIVRQQSRSLDETTATAVAIPQLYRRLLIAGLVISHTIGYSVTWYVIADKLKMPSDGHGKDVVHLAQWISSSMIFATMLFTIPWVGTMYFLWGVRLWFLQTSPLIAMGPFWLLSICIGRLKEADERQSEVSTFHAGARFLCGTTFSFMALTFVSCWGVAWALARICKWVSPDQISVPSSQTTTTSPTSAVQAAGTATATSSRRDDTEGERDAFLEMHICFLGALSIMWGVNFGQDSESTQENATAAGTESDEQQTVPSTATSIDSQAPVVPSFTTDTVDAYQDPHNRWPKRKTYSKFADERPELYQWLHFSAMFRMFRRHTLPAIMESWTLNDADNRSRPLRLKIQGFFCVLGFIAFMYIVLGLSFGWLAMMNFYQFPSTERTIKGLNSGVGWTSFAFFNLTTAVLYYTVAFDGSGTVNPGWTSVFGRR